MCIRDSFDADGVAAKLCQLDGELGKLLIAMHGADGVAYSCLLYTSDAADDLLCVDLGGRRIIKKKKHKQKNRFRIRHHQHILCRLEH